MVLLEGRIFTYSKQRLVAYTNGIQGRIKIVFVGGLGNNILSQPYVPQLNSYCIENGYELVIPQLRSHPNYGLYTIEDDAEDLDGLLSEIDGIVVLLGNSTGCQDIMYYMNSQRRSRKVKLMILQGAVSDVEYEESINKQLDEFIGRARELGPGELLKHGPGFITAERFLDLYSRYGKEDMFSSYLSDEYYLALNKTGTRILFIVSGRDEFSARDVSEKLKLVSNSTVKVLERADHAVSDPVDIEELITICDAEIKKIG
jgi:pimeloyl-ACP methyl ester carboxylesterase